MRITKRSNIWNLNSKYADQTHLKPVKNSYPGIRLSCCSQLGKTSACQNHIKARFIRPKFSFTCLVKTLSIFLSFLIIHCLILIPVALKAKVAEVKWSCTLLSLLAVKHVRHVSPKLEVGWVIPVRNTLHCFKTTLWISIALKKYSCGPKLCQ